MAGLVVATGASAVSAPAARAAPAAQGPTVKLIAAQHTITAQRFGNQVFVDPGIWVASLGAPLQLDVGRASYADPVTITQVISQPGLPPQTRPLPAGILDGWNGLKNFISLTIKNKAGRVVATTRLTLCPNSFDPERASPDGPSTSPYPQQCAAMDPFQIGTVWGIEQGWAVDAAQFGRTLPAGAGHLPRDRIHHRGLHPAIRHFSGPRHRDRRHESGEGKWLLCRHRRGESAPGRAG